MTGEVLQAFHHLDGPLLDSLSVQVSYVLGGPELASALQVQPYKH